MKNKIRNIIIFLCATLLLVCAIFSTNLVSADNVVILEDVNPTLQKKAIGDGDPWQAKTEYKEENGKYIIDTDGFCIWYEQDDFDYFYKQYAFNYGKKAVLSVETTVESWERAFTTSSAGIVIRSSLKADASTVFLHIRQKGVCAIYRAADGTSAKVVNTEIASYPMSLKVEITKNVAYCYYKTARSDKWVKLPATIPFVYGETIYTGLGAHATEQVMSEAVYDGFKVTVEAPEGTKPVEPGQSGEEVQPEEEEKVELPEDIIAETEDLLLYETFTDGDIFPEEATVKNPLWTTNNAEPNIMLNEDKTDRYMFLEMENKNYYFTGNENDWYDYSTQFDVNFSQASANTEINIFDFYVRRRFSLFNGVFYYGIRFETDINTGKGTLSLISDEYAKIGDAPFVRAQVDLDYISENFAGKKHTIKIDAFDNIISVYLDDMSKPILEYTDTESQIFKGNGGVGFYSDAAVVSVDNIIVRKLDDAVGGDYDNQINGNFDKQIPEFVDKFAENGWVH